MKSWGLRETDCRFEWRFYNDGNLVDLGQIRLMGSSAVRHFNLFTDQNHPTQQPDIMIILKEIEDIGIEVWQLAGLHNPECHESCSPHTQNDPEERY